MGDWIILTGICLLSSALAVFLLLPPRRRIRPGFGLLTQQDAGDPVFLFDGADLIGGSDRAEREYEDISDWDELRTRLHCDFPAFPKTPDIVQQEGEIVVPAIDSAVHRNVVSEWIDGVVRVQICDLFNRSCTGSSHGTSTDPMRLAMDKAPYPVWLVDHADKVSWCNAAYVALARRVRGQNADLSIPLFPESDDSAPLGKKTRISIASEVPDRKLWFDLSLVERDEGTLFYAVDINAVVDAEVAQRKFVQTLAKTFAQLSIGLAIFDRNRQLALFNPALVDLTALPADFLSSRPALSSFFDRLRNQNMMPEPKNYGGWRKQMNDLLEAAEHGRYQETWSMPSGSVYSVSGRPHPDGAVAFLFEDITAEITLTRRFRSELELGQAILDKLPDAVAVFSANGTLAFSNTAYHLLWDVDPDQSFALVNVLDATRLWQERCTATPVWGEIRDFVEMRENRADWTAQIRTRNGTLLTCAVGPMPNGATIVRFTAEAANTQDAQLETALP